MSRDIFPRAGDGGTYSIGSDSYPVTVRKVSPSGHVVWVSRDRIRSSGSPYERSPGGVYEPVDVPEEKWDRFTRRRDGSYRSVGYRCGLLTAGRNHYLDPSF